MLSICTDWQYKQTTTSWTRSPWNIYFILFVRQSTKQITTQSEAYTIGSLMKMSKVNVELPNNKSNVFLFLKLYHNLLHYGFIALRIRNFKFLSNSVKHVLIHFWQTS